ncbi:diguanylate cyclase [Arsukibacterium sp. MJ3]|uniref:sensor domain-containing diguanylate cyclase n=1 Tax=Arsukibacterium sp. MJ3 TaxID=1632859 RepID=UPI0013791D0A|nr:diguanylate cyclase [Arsukibacterium sp. MJ3]
MNSISLKRSGIIANVIISILLMLLSTISHASAAENCQLQRIDNATDHQATPLIAGQKSNVTVNRGENQFILSCSLQNSAVFSFQRHGLDAFSLQQNNIDKVPLPSAEVSFLIDKGTTSSQITLQSKFYYNPRFQWHHMDSFIVSSQKHNLIMGLFYGLSITLMLYVLILSSKVKDSALKLYSAYIFCITSFILLQEGQLYLYIASDLLVPVHIIYLFSIGLTVVSATWFMCEILKINSQFPRASTVFKFISVIVLIACLSRIMNHNINTLAISGMIMGYGTLILVAAIFFTSVLQMYRGVSDAGLVFAALLIVLVSMTFRIILLDSNVFIQRYGFIIAFAVEGFMLAIVVSRRIGRITLAKEKAENDAGLDMLCNILNRRGFTTKAKELINLQRQTGTTLGIFYVDIDNFKQLNDRYGHHIGDVALKEVANYLNGKMRMEDAVGRIGGDEFVALASFRNNTEIDAKFAELKHHFTRFSFNLQQQEFYLSASIGFAIFNTPPADLDTLLAAGDAAMYQAKSHRKAQALTEVTAN